MGSIATQIKEDVFTPELIKENEPLKNLDEVQIQAVVTLGNNLVADRIGKKTGETVTGIENDVREVSGIEKLPGERYFEYIKRAIAESKKAGDKELTAQLQSIKAENEQLKSGGTDEATKKQLSEIERKLKDKDTELTAIKTQYQKDLSDKDAALQEIQAKSFNSKVELNLDKEIAKLKFLPMPDLARVSSIKEAKQVLRSEYNIDFVSTSDGNEKMVFRNKETGDILLNSANSMEPFTEAEMLVKILNPVLDHGRKQTGSGGGPPKGDGPNKGQFFLNGAKNQLEADEAIGNQLVADGFARGSKEFDSKMSEIRKENGVDKLPFK